MTYTCPMHPEIIAEHAGTCPKCGMRLVPQGAVAPSPGKDSYLPLILVLAGIAVGTCLYARATLVAPSARELMRIFMGLFFLTFGFFKTLDWKGFAMAFPEYDLLAERSRAYAYAYPAIELTLGALYVALPSVALTAADVVTVLLMAVGAAGVYRALKRNRHYRCACLGVLVKLPMSTVTLVEDLGMGLMALAMLLMR